MTDPTVRLESPPVSRPADLSGVCTAASIHRPNINQKVKGIVILNAVGVAVSASISWLLIEWTRAALLKSQQGFFPLPALTSAVFNLKPVLSAPVVIFAVIAVLFVGSGHMSKAVTALVVSLV